MKSSSKTVSGWRAGLVALCLITGPAGSGTPLPETVLPCVPCHHRGDRDQVAEWLASPYSEAQGGRGCTSCHAESCEGNGGGGAAVSMGSRRWRAAVSLSVTASCPGGTVDAEVAISNVGVGHLLPTGSNSRSLRLEVAVHDRNRTPWALRATPVEPRLEPFATAVSRHRLAGPAQGQARVSARLFLVRSGDSPVEIADTETLCSKAKETR